MSIEEKILPLLRPTRRQMTLLGRLYRLISKRLEACMEARGLLGEVSLQGSFAKGTILSDKWEIDVFILIDGVSLEWIREEAEGFLLSCLKPWLPLVVKYSEQPYVTVSLMGMEADVVPVARSGGRLSGLGAERTPLHTEYVRKRLDERGRDEVRLLKSFLKGVGVYGAETRIRGFSGYLAELLVIYYGSFRGVLRAAAGWRPPVYIDPGGVGDEARLRRKYRDSPLIVVDPVDPERNAGAAVSVESLQRFVLASRLYLERPHPWFFHVAQPPMPVMPPLPGWVLRVECSGRLWEAPPDSVWGRLLRAARSLRSHLEASGFRVAHVEASTDESSRAVIEVLLESCVLPDVEVSRGPPPTASLERVARFILKRLGEGGGAWLEGGVLVGARRRPPHRRSAEEAVRAWLGSEASRPLRGLGVRCLVDCEACRGGMPACNPTPPWIASLSRA